MKSKLKWIPKWIFCVPIVALATPAFAWESQATANAAASAKASAGATAGAFASGGSAFARGGSAYAAGGAGGSARVYNNVSTGGTRGAWWSNIPPAFAPGTSTGANVCSSTLALGVPWASVGIPMPDEDCNRRNDASVVYGMHHRLEGQLIMCESYRVRAAFQAAGNHLCDGFVGWR